MGVTGIKNFLLKDGFITAQPFSDCTVLVDASGLMFTLLNSIFLNGSNPPFSGGNYREFEKKIISCFDKLKQCNILPVVVLDGATPVDKHKTKRVRLQTTLESYRSYRQTQIYYNILAKDVFASVLKKLKITIIQAPYEADDVLAFLSYRFELPILTNDSDFVFFRYPVLSLIDLEETETVKDEENNKFYLSVRTVYPAEIRERFRIHNEDYFRLAPTIIGNDIFRPLQDYFPGWRFFQGIHPGSKERIHYIRSILRWFGNSTFKDFDDFNFRLHEIIESKKSSVAIKYIAKMNQFSLIHLYNLPENSDLKNFIFSSRFPNWFDKSMNQFYCEKFPFSLSNICDRELNILLTKTDWHRPVYENFKEVTESCFEIGNEFAEIIYSCLLPENEKVILIQPKIWLFKIFELSNYEKIVQISNRQEWKYMQDEDIVRNMFILLRLAPQHFDLLKSLMIDKPDQLIILGLVVLRRYSNVCLEFIESILICMFLPHLANSRDDKQFWNEWLSYFESFINKLSETETLHSYNQFQIILSSLICLTRIMQIPLWNPSDRLSRLDGLFIAKLYAYSKDFVKKQMITKIFNRFDILKNIRDYIMTS